MMTLSFHYNIDELIALMFRDNGIEPTETQIIEAEKSLSITISRNREFVTIGSDDFRVLSMEINPTRNNINGG